MGMGGWIGFRDAKREEIGCPEGKYGYDNGFHTSCIATPKRETVVFFMDFMDSRTREVHFRAKFQVEFNSDLFHFDYSRSEIWSSLALFYS